MVAKSPVPVSAVGLPDGGRFMSQQETETLFGASIPVRYMDISGVYHSVTATVLPALYQIGIANQWNDTTGYLISGRNFMCYQFETEGTLNAEPRNITVDIACQYSIFDTEYIYTSVAMPCATSTNVSAYNSPSWSWYWAGSEVSFTPSDLAQNNVLPQVYFTDWCDFVPAYMESQAFTSGYSLRIVFDHASLSSGRYCRFYIGLPYVSQGAFGNVGTSGLQTGTTAAETTTGIDLGETNGLLGNIGSIISNVFQKVTGIFDALTETDIDTNAPDAIVTVPPDIDYEDALDNADAILDDVPDTVAASGFWWALYSKLFVQDVNGEKNPALIIVTIIPLAVLLGLMSHVLWKK